MAGPAVCGAAHHRLHAARRAQHRRLHGGDQCGRLVRGALLRPDAAQPAGAGLHGGLDPFRRRGADLRVAGVQSQPLPPTAADRDRPPPGPTGAGWSRLCRADGTVRTPTGSWRYRAFSPAIWRKRHSPSRPSTVARVLGSGSRKGRLASPSIFRDRAASGCSRSVSGARPPPGAMPVAAAAFMVQTSLRASGRPHGLPLPARSVSPRSRSCCATRHGMSPPPASSQAARLAQPSPAWRRTASPLVARGAGWDDAGRQGGNQAT